MFPRWNGPLAVNMLSRWGKSELQKRMSDLAWGDPIAFARAQDAKREHYKKFNKENK